MKEKKLINGVGSDSYESLPTPFQTIYFPITGFLVSYISKDISATHCVRLQDQQEVL